MKLRNEIFNKELDKLVEEFNSSIAFDKKLYREDIECSIAHAKMLAKTNIIKNKEGKKIINGLKEILKEIENGNIKFDSNNEDIHMNIEFLLTNKIGELGKKLHTARSRNDQVVTDLKLYAKNNIKYILSLIKEFLESILKISEKHILTIMPGYTHLQKAQPITFGYYLMAYFEMFKRDFTRLEDALKRLDVLPLGSCALAGTTLPIDREFTKNILGFKELTLNGIDAVSDRDFIVEVESVSSLIMVHLSRLCEELILWNSSEFNFIILDDSYVTGSSIMPQKKNPDVAELIRGKSGRVFGNLLGILTTLKGLPLSYNKDLQEDKEGFFDTLDTIKISLTIIKRMLLKMKINSKKMKKACDGFLNATDVADYLVKKGVHFRDAYHITAKIINKCLIKKINLESLSLEQYREFSKIFDKDIYEFINIFNCVNNRTSIGGTSKKEIKKHLKKSKNWISNI